jgi:hypothetical protein
MRRPCADREEKRVTRGRDADRTGSDQEQLDVNDPNQRRLLVTDFREVIHESIHRKSELAANRAAAVPVGRVDGARNL